MSPVNVAIPTLKWGKRKERSQMVEVLTVDGRWVDRELPALFNCAAENETRIAFILDPQNQYLAEDNNWHQLAWENSQIPLTLRETSELNDGKDDGKDLQKIGDQIFRLSSEKAQAEEFEKAKTSDIWNKIVWIISIVCGSMLIIVALQRFVK